MQAAGIEKLPNKGPFIITPNHQTYLDAPVLMGILPWSVFSRQFSVGTSEIFGAGLVRRIANSFNLVPVDPDANMVPAMKATGYGLRNGKILVIFPEGERTIDGPPKKFKKGAAILAVNLNVPIYPVALDGFFEAWPRGKGFQGFTRAKFAFGDPIYPAEKCRLSRSSLRADEYRAKGSRDGNVAADSRTNSGNRERHGELNAFGWPIQAFFWLVWGICFVITSSRSERGIRI